MGSSTPHEHLASHIRDALADDPRLNVLDIEVRIVAGVLHLHGELASAELLGVAEQIAREHAPQLPIVNRLTVCRPLHAPRHERIR
ncbi:MAG TPA: BON domain-containing protein [Polyangia bacterium]|nr:BON domain-containing protein [Polyangia bacterium]